MESVFNQFKTKGKFLSYETYGNGHINDTFLVKTEHNDAINKFILQKINHRVFKDVEGLMDNIEIVTSYVTKNFPNTVFQKTIKTKDGQNFFLDKKTYTYWRVYSFVENSVTHEMITEPCQFYETGIAFGEFQRQLQDFDSSLLIETIKDFHNTKKRFEDFTHAIKNDFSERGHLAADEIDFLFSRKHYSSKVVDLIDKKLIPLRVTHNDTKLNNVLLNRTTGKALTIIDLDTIMPGSILYDFGDAIRYGANTGKEDAKDLRTISLDLHLFKCFTEGFLKHTFDIINEYELKNLAFSSLLITYELSLRFLTDFLNGDIYFKTAYSTHNLQRAKAQIELLKDMEEKLEEMNKIIYEVYNNNNNK